MLSQGLSQLEVALRYNISSPALISHWHNAYRQYGMSGLTPKRQGRGAMTKPDITRKPDDDKTTAEIKRELAYLRTENAYLKKLDALLREREQTATKQGSSKD
jgi:transposase-like protein